MWSLTPLLSPGGGVRTLTARALLISWILRYSLRVKISALNETLSRNLPAVLLLGLGKVRGLFDCVWLVWQGGGCGGEKSQCLR